MALQAAKCLLPEVWMVSVEAFIEQMEIKPMLANIAYNTWGQGKKFEKLYSL